VERSVLAAATRRRRAAWLLDPRPLLRRSTTTPE